MSGVKNNSLGEENKPLTSPIVSKTCSKIEDDPNSLDSVISNLPLTIVPSLAKSLASHASHQDSLR